MDVDSDMAVSANRGYFLKGSYSFRLWGWYKADLELILAELYGCFYNLGSLQRGSGVGIRIGLELL